MGGMPTGLKHHGNIKENAVFHEVFVVKFNSRALSA